MSKNYDEDLQNEITDFMNSDDNANSINNLRLKLYNLSEQVKILELKNDKLTKKNFILEEFKLSIVNENEKLKEKVSSLEESLKIIEYEKEDLETRYDELNFNYENEIKNSKSLKLNFNRKEHEYKILKKENDEHVSRINELEYFLKTYIEKEENDEEESKLFFSKLSPNKELKNDYYSSSTVYSTSNKKLDCVGNLNDQNYENCLSNLYPELDLSDEECEKNSSKSILKVTSEEVVKRLSMINSIMAEKPSQILSPKKKPENKDGLSLSNDIYKEFFFLTYQAVIINSNELENLQKCKNEVYTMYLKFLSNNVPFHKV